MSVMIVVCILKNCCRFFFVLGGGTGMFLLPDDCAVFLLPDELWVVVFLAVLVWLNEIRGLFLTWIFCWCSGGEVWVLVFRVGHSSPHEVVSGVACVCYFVGALCWWILLF